MSSQTSRKAYRQAVIRACMQEYREDLSEKLVALHPSEPRDAEDLLYQICVAVNPGLEIHAVSLRADSEQSSESCDALQATHEQADGSALRRLRQRSRGLADRLSRRVLGQDEAVRRVAGAVSRAAAGLAEAERPLGTLLFTGRTGTGKTELARALAEELYGSEEGLLRVDCSEYALAHDYSKLVGAPPGYVGHEDGGWLTQALEEQPERVVLFDEIEKAHPRLHNLLLQVLEEGRLGDGQGRSARFDRTLIIMTSNAGADELADASEQLGFQPNRHDRSTQDEIVQRALRDTFAPEFLGRIDETVVFRELDQDDARAVAELQLAALATRARRRGHRVRFSRAVASWVAERGFSPTSGAREIRRVLRRELEAPLAERMLATPGSGRQVHVRVRAGQLAFGS